MSFRSTASRIAALCAAWTLASCAVAFAQAAPSTAASSAAPSAADAATAKAQLEAMGELAQKDPELANHFGLFTAGDQASARKPKLVAAANILSSVCGRRITPESLDGIAAKEGLYSENVYGVRSVLDAAAFCRLLSLGSGGRYVVSLDSRVEGRVPDDEAHEAEASSELFVVIAYLDHTPMIESRFAWGPEGSMLRVSVVNPLADPSVKAPRYKAKTDFDPSAFDAWEFYRFRKSIK
jgi:hypothetical protein